MALAPPRPVVAHSSLYRRVRCWQWMLQGILFLAVLVLGLGGYRRVLFLLWLLPLTFAPFSSARLRLHRELERALLTSTPRPAALLAVLTGLGVVLDIVMLAQLLTARLGSPVPMLHS